MRLIQENLFLVLLITGTLVIVGFFLGMTMHFETTYEEQLRVRQGVARNIQATNSREPKVNENIIKSMQEYNKQVFKDVLDAQYQNVYWTTVNLKIPKLEIVRGSGKTCDVLPFDKDLWGDNVLYPKYVNYYTGRIRDMLTATGELKMLRTVVLPSAEQIKARYDVILKEKLLRKRREDSRLGVTEETKKNTDEIKQLETESRQEAIQELKLRQSTKGDIYAEYNALTPKWQSGEIITRLTAEEVWNAQIDLWIKEEIIRAISKTIDDVMKANRVPDDKQNVVQSPIKRILSVAVQDAVSSDSRRDTGIRDWDEEQGSTTEESFNCLAPRGTNRVFEVYSYSVKLLMPVRYLQQLQYNMIKNNYHVITDITIKKPDPESTDVSQLYYYGTDPLCQIEIEAQMRMMTSWTRGEGRCDDEAKKINWSYDRRFHRPPLMPLNVLRRLPVEALRKIDQNRIDWE